MRKYNITKNLFRAGCIDGNKLWFVSEQNACLFEYDFEQNETVFHISLPNPYKVRQLIGRIAKDKNNVIMAPYEGNDFLIYNIETQELKTYPSGLNKSRKFGNVVVDKEKICFIGSCFPVIANYYKKTQEIDIVKDFFNNSIGDISGNKLWSRGYSFIDNEKIYIPLAQKNGILRFDFTTHKYQICYEGEDDGIGCNAIYKDNDTVIIIPRNYGDIKITDLSFSSIALYNPQFEHTFKAGDKYIKVDKKIYVLDAENFKIHSLDCNNGNINRTNFQLYKIQELPMYIGQKVLWIGQRAGNLLFSLTSGEILEWNENLNEYYYHDIQIKNNDDRWVSYISKQSLIEERSLSLNYFMAKIEKNTICNQSNIGLQIYEHLEEI